MNRDEDGRRTRIFLEASALDGERRHAYLDRACAGDPELRADVESLLKEDRRFRGLLDTGAWASDLPADLDATPERIGPYRVLERIGEGGMGIVFLCESSEPVIRRVAVKWIRFGLGSGEAVRRFELELRALARLNHPNIARLYDAGVTDDGRPYLVLEHVPGDSILEYCRANRPTLEARLDLFLDVCDAVRHAHRQAVIHRDLKPTNVLVATIDGRPVPKIIDFGIAKLLGDDRAQPETRTGLYLGTPEYMSPEQARPDGRLDTRADVYGLGLLLYELLTERRAFRSNGPGLETILRRVVEETPDRPSRVLRRHPVAGMAGRSRAVRAIERELDWIVMKALEKNPDRRYDSVGDLASDVRRHLEDRPIAARAPGPWRAAVKFARRHRIASVLAAALTLSLLTGVTAVSMQASRIADRSSKIERLNDFLLGLFTVDPAVAPREAPAPSLRAEALSRAREAFVDEPFLKARLYHAVGDLHRKEKEWKTALPLLEEAQAIYADELGATHSLTVAALRATGSTYTRLDRFEEAEASLLRAVEVARDGASAPGIDFHRASADLGYLYKSWGRFADAAEWLESAAEGLEAHQGLRHPETSIVRGFLAGVYLERELYAEAERILRELESFPPEALSEGIETDVIPYNLACIAARTGRPDEAVRQLERSLDVGFGIPPISDPHLDSLRHRDDFRSLIRRNRREYRSRTYRAVRWAQVRAALGDHESAVRVFEDVLSAKGPIEREFDTRLDLADSLTRLGRFHESEAVLREAYEKLASRDRIHTSNFSLVRWRMAQNQLGRGEVDAALESVRAILEIERFRSWGTWHAYGKAMEAALQGDHEAALDALALVAKRGLDQYDWLERDLAFRALRDDPRFRSLVAEAVEVSRF